MALADVDVPRSPAWWMTQLARRMLHRDRLMRFAVLDAYRSGCPPLLNATESQRKAFYQFTKVARSNFARVIVRAPAERMAVRAIRTAAAADENGDEVAWRNWTASGLDVVETDVNTDMLTFSEDYVRVAVGADGPIALKCDPRYTITMPDPLNPNRAVAAMHLVWDELAGMDYAYLWLPGEQWVASRPRTARPTWITAPGVSRIDGRPWMQGGIFPRLTFDPGAFTMRPHLDDIAEADRDGGPYCETFDADVVPVVRFDNRDGVGEFEEHLDLLDRINHTILQRVITAAVQAFKQRALQQKDENGQGTDRLPAKNPDTGETINWDELFMPGPDAMWKLPPGVSIWESGEVQLQPILSSAQDDVKHLSAVTSTSFTLFSPDGVNQSAEGAQASREGQTFKVEDRNRISNRRWAQVISLLFMFGPDADRYVGDGDTRIDRADAGRIVIDRMPAERFSLAERAQADSQNKSLSADMAAAKIWGLTPDEIAINRAQRAAEALLTPPPSPPAPTGAGPAA